INELNISPASIEEWAHAGWIDLRPANMQLWKQRLHEIKKEVELYIANDTSSRNFRTMEYWSNFNDIDAGKIVGWIFTEEEKGKRMK
ncbi:MAG: short-chain dehydrogenase, partial [Bacteroidetes bacterium]|nr:short-chain dehydrogenase [Bacteroidota bacterium]